MSSALAIGVSGLNAAQSGLVTTSHNIANAATPGYSRQHVVQSNATPRQTGAGFFGTGVRVESVVRSYSAYLDAQLRLSEGRAAELSAYGKEIGDLANLLADQQAGLSPSLQNFFGALQDLATYPDSAAARQSTLSGAEALVTRFDSLGRQIDEIRAGVNSQIQSSVTTINALARQVAEISSRITAVESGAQQPANDLRDQREQLVRDLSKEIGTAAVEGQDGTYSVFIGNGQPIVMGSTAYALDTNGVSSDPRNVALAYTGVGGVKVPLSENLLSGGRIGGLLGIRREALDPAQNALGRVAIGLASGFNAQHALGQDLNGQLGGSFFKVPGAQVWAGSANDPVAAAQLTVSLANVADLSTSDYRLDYDGANYTLTRLSDNTSWSAATLAGLPPAASPQGFMLTQTATLPATGMQAGDTFLIQPTRAGATQIAVAIASTQAIAAAAPVRTIAAGSNVGSGKISAGTVTSTAGLPLAASPAGDITLTFVAATNQFAVTGGPGGTLAFNPTVDAGGKSFTFPTVGGFSFSLSGVPRDGDTFVITRNSNARGDNRNALALGGLQSQTVLAGGTVSYQGAYAQMVSDVGSRAREVDVANQAQEVVVEQARASRESVAGVNLDEEAANLLRYQQAYQAAGKVIEITGRLFDSLLGMGR
ncbi:MAG: hypothetical protein IOMNBAOH_00677 [Rhodocyclaceae bacterium]|nr:hypothetical protein [Rhodocyclaceae bacterium]